MPAVKGDGMRGLAVFISDIRNCESALLSAINFMYYRICMTSVLVTYAVSFSLSVLFFMQLSLCDKCMDRLYHVICFLAVGKSREAEEKRINKELANIRSKFKGQFFHSCLIA